MANLNFSFDGQTYVSDVFSGGKVVQLAFPIERTRVLYLETRLASGLPWKVVDSRILEKQLVINVSAGGDGQEFRLNCMTEPTSAEIITLPSGGGGGSQPGPNTVGTEEIKDGAVIMDDLNQSVKDTMVTGDDRVTEEELDNFDV